MQRHYEPRTEHRVAVVKSAMVITTAASHAQYGVGIPARAARHVVQRSVTLRHCAPYQAVVIVGLTHQQLRGRVRRSVTV